MELSFKEKGSSFSIVYDFVPECSRTSLGLLCAILIVCILAPCSKAFGNKIINFRNGLTDLRQGKCSEFLECARQLVLKRVLIYIMNYNE